MGDRDDEASGEWRAPIEATEDTVSLGGAASTRRLDAFVSRLRARTPSAVIIASMVLLALGVLAALALAGRDSDSAATQPLPFSSQNPVPLPTADASGLVEPLVGGEVWLGYHGVMLALPRSWADSDSVTCGTTILHRAPPPRAPQSKCSSGLEAESSIVLWLRQDVEQFDPRDRGFAQSSVDGQDVFVAPMETAGSAYLQYVALPDINTLVVLRSPDRGLIEKSVRSLRGIPASWVSVPDLRGQDPQQALTTLAELDLVARADHNSGMALPAETVVVDQFPSGGQVVQAHTPVTIAVLPADQRS